MGAWCFGQGEWKDVFVWGEGFFVPMDFIYFSI
jgi:hypothetical protein